MLVSGRVCLDDFSFNLCIICISFRQKWLSKPLPIHNDATSHQRDPIYNVSRPPALDLQKKVCLPFVALFRDKMVVDDVKKSLSLVKTKKDIGKSPGVLFCKANCC